MSFLKSLWYGKPQPDHVMTVYLEELKQLSEVMTTLRQKFARYGRAIQDVSNVGLELGQAINKFNPAVRSTNPNHKYFYDQQAQFRDVITKHWCKSYIDDVIGMFEHFHRQTEAQRSTIASYDIAREHCYQLKVQLFELQDKKAGFIDKGKPLPPDFKDQLTASEEEYRKYSLALENMREAIVKNQNKLTGKAGEFAFFNRAFGALLELQCELSTHFQTLATNYQPLLDDYRRDIGMTPAQPGSTAVNQSFHHDLDINATEIANFLKQTATTQGTPGAQLPDFDRLLSAIADPSNEPNSASSRTSLNLTLQTGGTPAGVGASHGNLNEAFPPLDGSGVIPMSPPQSPGPRGGPGSGVLIPGTPPPSTPGSHGSIGEHLPMLSIAASARKKRQSNMTNPQSGNSFASVVFPPLSPSHTKPSSRRTSQHPGELQSAFPPGVDGHSNPATLALSPPSDHTQHQQHDEDNGDADNTSTPQEAYFVASSPLNDDDDDDDDQDCTDFAGVISRMIEEETDADAVGENDIATASRIAQRWATTHKNINHTRRNGVQNAFETYSLLAKTKAVDWVVISMEMGIWQRAQTLTQLICTLHTLQISRETGIILRGITADQSYSAYLKVVEKLAPLAEPAVVDQGVNVKDARDITRRAMALNILTVLSNVILDNEDSSDYDEDDSNQDSTD